MLRKVQTKVNSVAPYKATVGEEVVSRITSLALALRGARILHINVTGEGGGVVVLLTSLVPLMNGVDLTTEWQLLCHDDPFLQATKGFHNAFQRERFELTKEHRERYLRRNLYGQTVTVFPPPIEPHSPKNQALTRSHARQTVGEFGIGLGRPMLLQVARLGPWKDPEGAIETCRMRMA